MKTIISFLAVAILVFSTSCGGKKAGADCGPEMTRFMAGLGSSAKVSAALKQYGKDSLDTKDMGMYDLKDPKIVFCDKKEDKEVCTFEAKAGMTVRTYTLGWEKGKIVSVEDKGMK
jgi:hypothetical protein